MKKIYNIINTFPETFMRSVRIDRDKTCLKQSSFVVTKCILFKSESRSPCMIHYSNIDVPRINIHINLVWIVTFRGYLCNIRYSSREIYSMFVDIYRMNIRWPLKKFNKKSYKNNLKKIKIMNVCTSKVLNC